MFSFIETNRLSGFRTISQTLIANAICILDPFFFPLFHRFLIIFDMYVSGFAGSIFLNNCLKQFFITTSPFQALISDSLALLLMGESLQSLNSENITSLIFDTK